MHKMRITILLVLALFALAAQSALADEVCPKSATECPEGSVFAERHFKPLNGLSQVADEWGRGGHGSCPYICVRRNPTWPESWAYWLTLKGGGLSQEEAVPVSGSARAAVAVEQPAEPEATPTPAPTLEPTPSCAQCVALTLDGQTVHVTRWERKVDDRVWADVVDALTGEPIFEAVLESTDRWLPLLPTSTLTAEVASATPMLVLTATPKPTPAEPTATPTPAAATVAPTEQPEPSGSPAAAEVQASPTPSPTPTTVLKSSPTPSFAGEEGGTPPTPPATLVWRGRQFPYRGIARIAVTIFGIPPGGKLITQPDGVKIAGEAPFWRFWMPAITLLLLVGALCVPIYRRLGVRVHRTRDQEYAQRLERLAQDLEAGGQNANPVRLTLDYLRR